MQVFWSDLIGAFFNYLAFDAAKSLNKKNGLLGYESATGYASAVKKYLLRCRFRHKPQLRVFAEDSWRELRNLLLTKFKDRQRRTGKRITTPKIASTPEDRKAIGQASFWLGSSDAAEFHGLNVMAFHLVGRGREVSTLVPEDLSTVRATPSLENHHNVSVELQNDKDGPLQDLTIYPHFDAIEETLILLSCTVLVSCGW